MRRLSISTLAIIVAIDGAKRAHGILYDELANTSSYYL